VLEDPLTKSISPSALREHMCNMCLWHSLRFRTIKGPKAKEFVSVQRCVLWLLNLSEIDRNEIDRDDETCSLH
jgi:hypothetical protein